MLVATVYCQPWTSCLLLAPMTNARSPIGLINLFYTARKVVKRSLDFVKTNCLLWYTTGSHTMRRSVVRMEAWQVPDFVIANNLKVIGPAVFGRSSCCATNHLTHSAIKSYGKVQSLSLLNLAVEPDRWTWSLNFVVEPTPVKREEERTLKLSFEPSAIVQREVL